MDFVCGLLRGPDQTELDHLVDRFARHAYEEHLRYGVLLESIEHVRSRARQVDDEVVFFQKFKRPIDRVRHLANARPASSSAMPMAAARRALFIAPNPSESEM